MIQIKNVLNAYFDKIYCITCFEDVDRQKRCKKEFEKFSIEFEFVTSIDKNYFEPIEEYMLQHACKTSAAISLDVTHFQCIKSGIANGHSKIAIFEDDFVFYDKWELVFNQFIKNLPENWDAMFLGEALWAKDWCPFRYEQINDVVGKCEYICGTHFMGINCMSPNIHRLWQTINHPIDILYNNLFKQNLLICYAPIEQRLADAMSMPPDSAFKNPSTLVKNEFTDSKCRMHF
jgi:GR25 family glycosyltransferase involved in LPS biosynthesis